MAFCRVVFSFLVLSVISCYASKVPVFLWGDSVKSYIEDPLTTLHTKEFSEIINGLATKKPLIVVFIEPTLSVEDFSLKNENGETSFPYLHDNLDHAIYLPSVDDALVALNQSSIPMFTDNIVIDDDDVPEEIGNDIASEGRYIFINLKDARDGEPRSAMLRRHDDLMAKTIENMPDTMNVVGIYTANDPSWTISEPSSRVRREVKASPQIYSMDGLLVDVDSINLYSGNDSRTLTSLTGHSSDVNTTSVNATLTFDNTTLLLNFNLRMGYWFFDTVVLTVGSLSETLWPSEEVYALVGFSYRCGHHVRFSSINESTTYTISFENMQIQPFFETSNATLKFGDSFNCVGFFSAPIWAGLFVVAILLSITFYGIMMMLDIRTMDRFDDPKGKTITINAAE